MIRLEIHGDKARLTGELTEPLDHRALRNLAVQMLDTADELELRQEGDPR